MWVISLRTIECITMNSNTVLVDLLNQVSNVSSFSDRVVTNAKNALDKIKSVDDIVNWLGNNRKSLALLKSMRKRKLEHGGKLEANIFLLKTINEKLKQKKVKTVKQGAGLSSERSSSSSARRHLIWSDIESHYDGRVKIGAIINMDIKEPLTFFKRAFKMFKLRVHRELVKTPLKIFTIFTGEFVKPVTEECDVKTFTSSSKELYLTDDLHVWYNTNVQDKYLTMLEEFQERDSGWALNEIINLRVYVNKYTPISAAAPPTSSTFHDLPDVIKNKKAVVNVKNNDVYCFLWSIMSALYPTNEHSERTGSYPHYDRILNYEGISFPMKLKNIHKFEMLNANISINVYSYDILSKKNVEIYPVHVSKKYDAGIKKIHLLLVNNNAAADDDLFHFCWIKNLAKLARSGVRSGNRHKIIICDMCLNYFSDHAKLSQHQNACMNQKQKDHVKLKMPACEKDKCLKFKNYDRQEKVRYIVYADFEAVLKNIAYDEELAASSSSYTIKTHRHEAFSVGYYLKCSHDDSQSYYKFNRGENCINWFIHELYRIVREVEPLIYVNTPMNSNDADDDDDDALSCHICNVVFQQEDIRVRDHDHLSGRYRGMVHQSCNLNYKEMHTIPIVFHNLSGYDAHFIIRALMREIEGPVSLLPINKDRYISFTKHVSGTRLQLRFIDSFRFMASSLDMLASYLSDDNKIILRKHYCEREQQQDFQLLTRKGVFPYEYVDSCERLNETQLPPHAMFYSSLYDENVSDEDYAHATHVWRQFGIKTLGEYSDLYLKTDVLLLADVFENFRDTCLTTYGLDPAHYYTAPGFTWDAMLKFTNIRLELFTDVDMLLFIESGIRGGVSQCSNRYASANNKYMNNGEYDPNRPSEYLMYYDVVNLYGHTMSQYLPTGNFKWLQQDDTATTIAMIMSNEEESSVGYILEVDLTYPRELHDLHSDLPLCPETRAPPGSKQVKLLTTLHNKTRYVIHYRNLKQCIRLGMAVTRCHRVLQFDQSPWLKSYIDLNTDMRKRARNDFEKNLYKLLINAIFGKTMENLRKHRNIFIRKTWGGQWGVKSLVSKPNFNSLTMCDTDIAIIEMNKTAIFFNRPIYIGFCVLDISKTFVYDFHYNYIHPMYSRDNVKLLYTDTDSLIYSIKTDDVYANMRRDIDRFDTSDYMPDNPYGIPLRNKKVLGLMSDENNGAVMLEFVGLRSKMYAIKVQDRSTVKKSKGLKRATVKKLTFDDYMRCLITNSNVYRTQQCVRSIQHNIFTVKQNKVGLSPHDNKRLILVGGGGNESLPYGHYSMTAAADDDDDDDDVIIE